MVNKFYSVLKCNIPAEEQDEFNEHCRMVHGIIPGHLKRQQTIKIDSKLPVKLETALDIENVGPDQHDGILHGWFTKGT